MARLHYPQTKPPRQAASFPYEVLLAYRRGEVVDESERRRIEKQIGADPRWRAHWHSVGQLDLDMAEALSDAKELDTFGEQATEMCRLLAEKGEQIFAAWNEQSMDDATFDHLGRCVYCRRRWFDWKAERAQSEAGVSAEEPLLREWLLRPIYQEPLERVTAQLQCRRPTGELAAALTQNLPLFLRKMSFVAPLLLERASVAPERIEAGAVELVAWLGRVPALERLQTATHVRERLGELVAAFCGEQGLADPEQVRNGITANVVDNVLWQLAARLCEEEVGNAPEASGLRAVRKELEEQLSKDEPEAPAVTISRALSSVSEPSPLRGTIEERFAELTR